MLAPSRFPSGQSEVRHHLFGFFQEHGWLKAIWPLHEDSVHLQLFCHQVCHPPLLVCLAEAHSGPCALSEVLPGQLLPWVVAPRLAFWASLTLRFLGWLGVLRSLWAVEGVHSHSSAASPLALLPLECQELSMELAAPGPWDEPWRVPWPGST